VIPALARQATGAGENVAAVPVKRGGRILFIAPDDRESGMVKLKEWEVREGIVYDVAVVPEGGVRVSKTGCQLIVYVIQGDYSGDDSPERVLSILVYEREAPGVPFGDPEFIKHGLRPGYLSRVVYDETTGKVFLNYTSGHH
jgi:hypothetical protein